MVKIRRCIRSWWTKTLLVQHLQTKNIRMCIHKCNPITQYHPRFSRYSSHISSHNIDIRPTSIRLFSYHHIYICIYIYLSIYLQTYRSRDMCIYIYIYLQTYRSRHVYIYTYTYIYKHIDLDICIYICMYTYIYKHIDLDIRVHMYIYMYIYINIYTNI